MALAAPQLALLAAWIAVMIATLLTNVCMVLCGWGNGLLAPGVLIIALGLDFKFGMSWCGASADWFEARKLAFLLLAIGALLIGLSYVASACPGIGKAPA